MWFKNADGGKLEEFKQEARKERESREERGEGDRYMEMQMSVMPELKKLKGFKIEMLFEDFEADGTVCLEWYHGVVKSVLNAKSGMVMVEWDDECLHEEDKKTMKKTKERLMVTKWNPKVAVKGGWCKYLTK